MKSILNGLVKVRHYENKYVVSGRELHDKCKVQKKFTDWIKQQIDLVDIKEDEFKVVWTKDSRPFKVVAENDNLQQMRALGYQQDYLISLDIAKEICMVMGVAPRTNPETKKISKDIRRYFIDCERYIEEKKQKELFNQWRKDEATRTREFYDDIDNNKDTMRISIALYTMCAYVNDLDFIYRKEDLYKRYLKEIDKQSWITYLEMEETMIHFVKTYMAKGSIDYVKDSVLLFKEYYIGDSNKYKEYIKSHKVYN